MGWSISGADEFFHHQVPYPLALVGTSDPSWRERYWLSIQDVAQQHFILSLGFGKYPNQDVFEGFVIAQHGNRQRNLRVSRQLLPQWDRMEVGPMAVRVLEPLQTLEFTVQPNPSGVHGRFTFHAAMPAMLEGRHFEIHRARVSHDLARYVQLGRVEGELTIGEASFTLTRDAVWGERDHSWGMRPLATIPGEPPVQSAEWNFLAFCPLQFPDFCVHLYLFESQWGRPTHLSASLVRRDGSDEADAIESVSHDFEWVQGAPVLTLHSGRICLHRFDAPEIAIDLVALAPRVFLQGGGYGVDHGRWKGETHLEHEMWDLDDAEALRRRAASSSDHLVEARCGEQTGYGIIEYMVRRGHRQYAAALPPTRRTG